MIIMGIDPGTATTGYGVITVEGSYRYRLVDYGCITTPAHTPMADRLLMIYQNMRTLLDRLTPDQLAIEQLFFNTNTTTAISVAQARGVLVLAAVQKGLPIGEYTPLQVKQSVVGYGKADKKQVQYMVSKLLGLKDPPRPDDAADALALAICHSHYYTTRKLRGE